MLSSLRIAFAVAFVALASSFTAGAEAVTVTVGTVPAGVAFTVDGTQYTSAVTFTWTIGSTHTLSATSPQTDSTTQYAFNSWSDSGALSHTVAASSTTSSYTANFTTAYELTIATSNSHGSVTPTSGSYYAAGSSVSIDATPAGNYYLYDWTGSSDIADDTAARTTITMNGPESITANFHQVKGIQYFTPVYIVTTAGDDATGVAANCPVGGPATGGGMNCSLRDALEAATEAGGGNIQFDNTAFASTNTAAQNTITLTNGPLYLSTFTLVHGPTAPNGNTYSNLITVSGNSQSGVFWVVSGVHDAGIQNLNIVNGSNGFGGAGIYTDGGLFVWNATISGNSAAGGQGGGIYIDSNGSLQLNYSTLSGNSADTGGGLANYGTLKAAEDTFSGNQATTLAGGIYASGQTFVTNCTVSGNHAAAGSAGGIAVAVNETLKLTNSIVSGNDSAAPLPDLQGTYTDGGGNQVAVGPLNLSPLGNFGGPTQTIIPLPWSPAICSGLASNLSALAFWDQRGYPDTNSTYPGYSLTGPCVDSGAVQTNYSIAFSTPPTPVAPDTSILMSTPFTAAVALTENGNPVAQPVTVPLSLTGSGSLGGNSAVTSAGIATFSSLQIDTAGTGDVLMATLALNPPNSPFPLAIAAATGAFDVTSLATTTTASSVSAPFSSTAQSVALDATVTSTSDTVSAGTVRFTLTSGGNVVGTPATGFVADGQASVNYILPAGAAPGSYTINAVYNAAGGFTTSSDASHALTIAQAMSSVALTSSAGSANLNAGITFTAVVTGAAGTTPTGSVTFMEGAQSLGSGTLDATGTAAYTTSSLAAGTHAITAAYSGDIDFAASTSAQFTQVIAAPAFTVAADPATLSVAAGSTGTATFTLTPVGGFTGSVNFACSELPADVSCSFSPPSVTADGSNAPQSTTLTVSTTTQTASSLAPSATIRFNAKSLAGFSWIPCVALGLLLARGRRRMQRAGIWSLVLCAAAALLMPTGCGGSSSPKAKPGTYAMAITATPGSGASGGATAQTVAITLTVTQ
jgi:hypothetical protein